MNKITLFIDNNNNGIQMKQEEEEKLVLYQTLTSVAVSESDEMEIWRDDLKRCFEVDITEQCYLHSYRSIKFIYLYLFFSLTPLQAFAFRSVQKITSKIDFKVLQLCKEKFQLNWKWDTNLVELIKKNFNRLYTNQKLLEQVQENVSVDEAKEALVQGLRNSEVEIVVKKYKGRKQILKYPNEEFKNTIYIIEQSPYKCLVGFIYNEAVMMVMKEKRKSITDVEQEIEIEIEIEEKNQNQGSSFGIYEILIILMMILALIGTFTNTYDHLLNQYNSLGHPYYLMEGLRKIGVEL